MSFLTPLYVLGVLTVVAPIIFHLIRRAPKGEVPFSSLMFLSPTPPKLTRRSRLDNLLLLLLRVAALCLLAFAFARPFLRQAASANPEDVSRKRVAVLIDTSASMRRGDLWLKAKAIASEVIAESRPADQLALFAYDATSRTLLGFEESTTLDPARRQAVAVSRFEAIGPSWSGTNLGQALIDAVSAIDDLADTNEKSGRMPRKVVLISDLQQGSRLDALGDFEWPSDVELDLRTVSDPAANAGLHPIAEITETDSSAKPSKDPTVKRVRISNDAGSLREAFTLSWVDSKGNAIGSPIDAYVPPGESRVVRVPNPAGSATSHTLRLSGDSQGFDNMVYFADERHEESTVLYIGKGPADDPAELLYYLERVFSATPQRAVEILAVSPSAPLSMDDPRNTPLVIIAAETTSENAGKLRKYLTGGGTVLFVATGPGTSETLAGLADRPQIKLAEAEVKRDVMLGEVAFDHPIFAPLAAAQFNDFTKIHFWKYRTMPLDALGTTRALAKFENGSPAISETLCGSGRLVVFMSGWTPTDSQLARSSKFVPLMTALLEIRDAKPFVAENDLVGGRISLPIGAESPTGLVIHKPSGEMEVLAKGAVTFGGTDEPGVYQVETPAGPQSFAVNLDPSESKTSPLAFETLEQYGCKLSNPSKPVMDREQLRQLQNIELEGRQKFWRWLVLAAVGVLIVETMLAGRLDRSRTATVEALAS